MGPGWRTGTPGVWAWRRCDVQPSANAPGKVVMINSNGTVVSIQPDGREESRPAGTDGLYEQATLAGDKVVYDYDGIASPIVYTVAFPNPKR